MIKILSIIVLAIFLASSAWPMAKENATFANDRRADPATSVLLGIQGDYNKLGNAQTNWSALAGLATPITGSGKFYFLAFGEGGKVPAGEEYAAETRLIYYLKKPGTGLAFGLLIGSGVTWVPTESELTDEQKIAYLLGTAGVVLSLPTEFLGFWGGLEFQMGQHYSTYRAGAGVNVFLADLFK